MKSYKNRENKVFVINVVKKLMCLDADIGRHGGKMLINEMVRGGFYEEVTLKLWSSK